MSVAIEGVQLRVTDTGDVDVLVNYQDEWVLLIRAPWPLAAGFNIVTDANDIDQAWHFRDFRKIR